MSIRSKFPWNKYSENHYCRRCATSIFVLSKSTDKAIYSSKPTECHGTSKQCNNQRISRPTTGKKHRGFYHFIQGSHTCSLGLSMLWFDNGAARRPSPRHFRQNLEAYRFLRPGKRQIVHLAFEHYPQYLQRLFAQ